MESLASSSYLGAVVVVLARQVLGSVVFLLSSVS